MLVGWLEDAVSVCPALSVSSFRNWAAWPDSPFVDTTVDDAAAEEGRSTAETAAGMIDAARPRENAQQNMFLVILGDDSTVSGLLETGEGGAYHGSMTPEEFESIINATLDEIEEAFPGCLENVAVCVEERCGRIPKQAVKLRHGDTLMGLYQGVPRTERSYNEIWMMPDKITLFVQPILAEAKCLGRPAAEVIREVVWHEVGHLLGLDEKRARAAEQRRRGF